MGSAPATFVFSIPQLSNSASRSPKYLSSATKSVTLQVTDTKNHGDSSDIFASVPAALKVVQTVNFANTIGNPATPGQCGADPGNAANIKCTAVFQLPIGDNTFAIASWDASGGTGNKLSEQISTKWTQQGAANAYSISLDANASTMTVSGSGSCQNGPVGSAFGSAGTTPIAFTVAYTDAATKTVVGPGLPMLAIQDSASAWQTASGTVNGTGGTVSFSINQATQTFTLTPSNSTTTNASINVRATPANVTDGLSFTQTKSFAFSTGVPPPAHNFLAAVEQFGVGSGAVDFFTVALGGSGSADSLSAYSPATLATTASTNEGKPDVDNPLDLAFDATGDLLIGNGGTTTGTPQDNGNLACVPIGAIATGANTSTTISTNVDDPVAIAYDSRDGSVALGNNPTSSPVQLAQYLLTGNYSAAPAARNLTATGYGVFAVANIPTMTAGTFAVGLTDGLETDPAHNTGKSKVAIIAPTGAETDITDPTTFAIDVPHGLAWDPVQNQLVVANYSAFHKLLSFYTLSPATLVKTINTGRRNDKLAVSADGHVAVAGTTAFGTEQIQVYDNTAARNPVGGPIPFNTTTTSCGSTYIYDNGIINSMTWLSNTKLLVALQSNTTGTPTAANGLYVFDISVTSTPAGFDDVSCSAETAAPKQTGFVHIANKPLGTAYKP